MLAANEVEKFNSQSDLVPVCKYLGMFKAKETATFVIVDTFLRVPLCI